MIIKKDNDQKGVESSMKVDFFYTWTKNKETQSEYMKSFSGGFWLPNFFKFLKVFFSRSLKE